MTIDEYPATALEAHMSDILANKAAEHFQDSYGALNTYSSPPAKDFENGEWPQLDPCGNVYDADLNAAWVDKGKAKGKGKGPCHECGE